jgi:hypothetical protein
MVKKGKGNLWKHGDMDGQAGGGQWIEERGREGGGGLMALQEVKGGSESPAGQIIL